MLRAIRCSPATRLPGWRLAIGERQQHDPFDSAEPIPDRLMGVAGLGEREVDGGCRQVLGLAGLIEQVVEVVGEQYRALRVSAGEREQFVECAARIQAVSYQQDLDVVSCLDNGERR